MQALHVMRIRIGARWLTRFMLAPSLVFTLLTGNAARLQPEVTRGGLVSVEPRPAAETPGTNGRPLSESTPRTAAVFSPGIAAIVRMLEAGVSAEVVRAFIQNSEVPYHPTPDELIALKDRAVPTDLMVALITRGGELRRLAASQARANASSVRTGSQSVAASPASPYYDQPATYATAALPATYATTTVTAPYSYSYWYSYPSYPTYSYWWWTPYYYHRSFPHYRGHYNHWAYHRRWGPGHHNHWGHAVNWGHRRQNHWAHGHHRGPHGGGFAGNRHVRPWSYASASYATGHRGPAFAARPVSRPSPVYHGRPGGFVGRGAVHMGGGRGAGRSR